MEKERCRYCTEQEAQWLKVTRINVYKFADDDKLFSLCEKHFESHMSQEAELEKLNKLNK